MAMATGLSVQPDCNIPTPGNRPSLKPDQAYGLGRFSTHLGGFEERKAVQKPRAQGAGFILSKEPLDVRAPLMQD